MTTTFPVKDNTIRINFVNLCNELFVSVVGICAIKGFGDLLERRA